MLAPAAGEGSRLPPLNLFDLRGLERVLLPTIAALMPPEWPRCAPFCCLSCRASAGTLVSTASMATVARPKNIVRVIAFLLSGCCRRFEGGMPEWFQPVEYFLSRGGRPKGSYC